MPTPAGLDRLVDPLRTTCSAKVKQNSVKQEFEKQDELKRSAELKVDVESGLAAVADNVATLHQVASASYDDLSEYFTANMNAMISTGVGTGPPPWPPLMLCRCRCP